MPPPYANGPEGAPWPGPAQPPYAGAPWPNQRRRFLPFLVTGVAGLLIGAVIVGVVWAAAGHIGGTSNADKDASAACDIYNRAPTTWSESTYTQAIVDRLEAGVALADAAGQDDARYKTLAAQALQVHQLVLTNNVDQLGAAIKTVRDTCGNL